MTVKEVAEAAKEEGMTYGQYVQKYDPGTTPDPEPKETVPAAKPQQPEGAEKTCLRCGKKFRVLSYQHRKKYCSDACRNADTYERSRQKDTKDPSAPASEPEKRAITFGDILDLLGRDSTEVELRMGDDNISGAADSRLWKWLEPARVENIGVNDGYLTVWLEDRSWS